MLKSFNFTVISLMIFFSFMLFSEVSFDHFPEASATNHSYTLWLPQDMLKDKEYYGLILLDSKQSSDITFDITTDNEEVLRILTEQVFIEQGKHHGLIRLETTGTGNADIYAIYQDILLQTDVAIVESAEIPIELDLLLPSNLVDVLIDQNKNFGYVFLLNDFNNPVPAPEPIRLDLTSDGEIVLQKESITIEKGSHYTKFAFEASGEGTITVNGPNLEPDDEDISTDEVDEIELIVEVAPDPIPTSEHGEIYFWLEREGKPYLPDHDLDITISIDKSANLSFNDAVQGAIVLTESTSDRRTDLADAREIITVPDVQLEEDSRMKLVLEKGEYYGKVQAYTSFDSATGIMIGVLAESIDPREDEEVIREFETISVSTETTNSDFPTQTNVWALPDPAYDKVEIIVSSSSENGPVIENDDETVTVFGDTKIDVASGIVTIKEDDNYAILVATTNAVGTTEIFAEREEASSASIEIEIEEKYVRDPQIDIVDFPVIFGKEQDLFLITSTHDKIRVDAEADAEEGHLVSVTSIPAFDYIASKESESVIVIKGTISESLDRDPEIHIASNADTATETLDVYNPDRTKIETIHPESVYEDELFPLYTYITDLGGNIISTAEMKISSGAEISKNGDLYMLEKTGEHGIIFYDRNTVPIRSEITVKGEGFGTSQQSNPATEQIIRVFTYEVTVDGGQGSGIYEEDQEVTISAPEIIDDIGIMKKKLVGWEDLPYKNSTVTFEVDEDIETRPIYETDYTMLFGIIGGGAAIGAIIYVKKRKKDEDYFEDEELTSDTKSAEDNS